MTRPERHQPNDSSGRRALALGLVAAAAAAGLRLLAGASARRVTAEADEALREATAPPPDHPVREVAAAVAPVGKWYTYLPMALGASALVLAAPGRHEPGALRSRGVGVGAILLAGAVATKLNPVFDDWLPQPPAPPGHSSPRKPVFPSGHAFGPGTVSLTTAYVLAREGIARPGVAFPAALGVPILTAGGRVIVEKHWASDILGGYVAALAVASASAAAYEAARGVADA